MKEVNTKHKRGTFVSVSTTSKEKQEVVDFSKIEKKWQDKWEKNKVFEVKEGKGKKYGQSFPA